MGSSLNLSESDVFGIKLNNLNNEFQATRAHKRALTNLINDGFGQFLSRKLVIIYCIYLIYTDFV